MKKFKKIIAMSMVFGVMFCAFGVNAKKISDREGVKKTVEESIVNSLDVTTVKAGSGRVSKILAICEKRIGGLNKIIATASDSRVKRAKIPALVGKYFNDCGISARDCERVWLSDMPDNRDDLIHNAQLLRGVYLDIHAKFSSVVSGTSAEEESDMREPPQQRLDRREGRKGERRQRGHFRYR